MSTVHFLLLDHTDEHSAHKAIQKYKTKGKHGNLSLAATSSAWGALAMHAITADQGFTCHDHIGDGPSSGYMVSLAKVAESVFAIADLTPEHIAEYRDKNEATLADKDNFLGAWVYEGNVYLDVSRHMTSKATAMDLAKANDQIGVYDIGKGETIVTKDYFKEQQNKAATKVFWSSSAHDVAMVNRLRARAGLPALVHDTTGVIARRALRLVSKQE